MSKLLDFLGLKRPNLPTDGANNVMVTTSRKPNFEPPVPQLPDEILLIVFLFLPPRVFYRDVPRICKRWKQISATLVSPDGKIPVALDVSVTIPTSDARHLQPYGVEWRSAFQESILPPAEKRNRWVAMNISMLDTPAGNYHVETLENKSQLAFHSGSWVGVTSKPNIQ
ncbi:hypothetical protein HDU93_009103, partial [Gonapodya sp. JEL0774]